MSSVGAGSVVAAGAGAAVVPLPLSPLLFCVIGGGILIGRGLMWCGEKMEQNYQNACQEWTYLKDAAHAESRANVQEMSMYLTTQLDRLTADAFLATNVAASQPVVIEPQELRDALARARNAVANGGVLAQNKADAEKALLVARLTAEIKAGRGVLPSEKIAQAENALHGTAHEMRNTLALLDAAWLTVTEVQAQQSRFVREAQHILGIVSTQLSVIDTMLQDAGNTRNSSHVEQHRSLTVKVQEVRDYLDINAKQALEKAREVQQAVGPLMEEVSATALDAWETTRTRVNQLCGTLGALTTMVNEAKQLDLVPLQRLNELAQRITNANTEAEILLQGNVSDIQRRIVRLTQRIDVLKDEVFTDVKGNQQRTVMDTIQSTLAELGFRSTEGEQLVIKHNGDTLRVEAVIAKGKTAEQRDDKVVTFDVSLNGQVVYDFSGYVGSTCVDDAKRVFAALRRRGIFILDDNGLEQLERIPSASITEQTLNQELLQLKIQQNKSQAELAEALKGVLAKMGYPTIQESAITGFIELEAFKGQHGYRVVLSPDGEFEIFKDAHNISEDTHDTVTSEAKRIVQDTQERNEQQQTAKKQRSYMQSPKKQKLG